MSYKYTEYTRPSVQSNTFSGYGSLGNYNAQMSSPCQYSTAPVNQKMQIVPTFGGAGYTNLQHGRTCQRGNTGFFQLNQAYKTNGNCSSLAYSTGRYCQF